VTSGESRRRRLIPLLHYALLKRRGIARFWDAFLVAATDAEMPDDKRGQPA
jgi:hypothetical protein